MLAGIAAGIVYCKLHNIDWVALADIVSPSLLIGQSIGRMANLLNGDAFGTPTGGSFGILYPEGTLAYKTYGPVPLWPAEVWEGQLDIGDAHDEGVEETAEIAGHQSDKGAKGYRD